MAKAKRSAPLISGPAIPRFIIMGAGASFSATTLSAQVEQGIKNASASELQACVDQLDAEMRAKLVKGLTPRGEGGKEFSEPEKQLRVGIMGFGNFGQFLAKEFLKQNHLVFATSRSSYVEVCAKMGVTWVDWSEGAKGLLEKHKVEVLLISTSIISFEQTIKSLPFEVMKAQGPLLVDVCSVKTFPKRVMLESLPENCGILCTHPMFGPESGKHGWQDLPFMFEHVRRVSKKDNKEVDCSTRFVKIFETAGCRMVDMSCEEHDRHSAASQFITHLTGRVLAAQGCQATPIDTKGFKSLQLLVENTCKDSFELFYGLYKYNPNSADQLASFAKSLEAIDRQLRATAADGASGVQLPTAAVVAPGEAESVAKEKEEEPKPRTANQDAAGFISASWHKQQLAEKDARIAEQAARIAELEQQLLQEKKSAL